MLEPVEHDEVIFSDLFVAVRGVVNFLEVGGLKTVSAKFLRYHTPFCMTTPPFNNV